MKVINSAHLAGFFLICIASLSYAKQPVNNKGGSSDKSVSGNNSHSEEEFSLGIAFLSSESMYKENERDESILPMIEWRYENWFLSNYRIGSYLYGDSNFYASTSIGFESIGRLDKGSSDSPSDKKDIDQIYNVSLSMGLIENWGVLEVSIYQDISQGHKSHTYSLSYSYEIPLGSWSVLPAIQLTYLSSDVVNYYFGVGQKESNQTKPKYNAERAYSANISVYTAYQMDQSNSLIFGLGYHIVPDEIKNSPLTVSKKGFENITLGYVYVF